MAVQKMLDRVRELCDAVDELPPIDSLMVIIGADRSSITGRIADLRREGYRIDLKNGRYIVRNRPEKKVSGPAVPVDIEEVLRGKEEEIARLRHANLLLLDAIKDVFEWSVRTPEVRA